MEVTGDLNVDGKISGDGSLLTDLPASAGSIFLPFAPATATGASVPYYKTVGTGSLPSTGVAGLGLGASLDPYVVVAAGTNLEVTLTVGGGSVSQATVGAAPTARIDVFDVDGTSETLIGTYRIEFVTGTFGIFSTPSASFQTGTLSLPQTITAGMYLGVRYITENSDNEKLNGIVNGGVTLKVY